MEKKLNNKKGKGEIAIFILVGAVLLLIFQSGGFSGIGFAPKSIADDGTPIDGGQTIKVTGVCPDPSNTLTVGPAQARNLPGTSVSTVNHRLYLNNVDQGNFADGTTATVNAGSKVEVVYGLDSGTYNSDYVTFAMPCGPLGSSEVSESGSSFYDAIYDKAHKMWTAETQPTFFLFNGDTGNLNNGTGAENETIGAADTGRFTNVRLVSDSDSAISPPRHGLAKDSKVYVVVELNGSLYDSSKTLLGGATKSSYRPSSTVLTLDNAVDELVVFEVVGCPSGTARACDLSLGTLSIETKSGAGNDPGSVSANGNGAGTGGRNAAAVGAGAIKITLVYSDFWRHTLENTVNFGPQLDDGSYGGNAGADVYYLSVA